MINNSLTREELKLRLESRVVYEVHNEFSNECKKWGGDGAVLHRVIAAGFSSETGARNIREGNTPISIDSTFEDLRKIDKKMYEGVISFLYPFAVADVFSP